MCQENGGKMNKLCTAAKESFLSTLESVNGRCPPEQFPELQMNVQRRFQPAIDFLVQQRHDWLIECYYDYKKAYELHTLYKHDIPQIESVMDELGVEYPKEEGIINDFKKKYHGEDKNDREKTDLTVSNQG